MVTLWFALIPVDLRRDCINTWIQLPKAEWIPRSLSGWGIHIPVIQKDCGFQASLWCWENHWKLFSFETNRFVLCFQSQMGRAINSFGGGGIELLKRWVGVGINFRWRDVCMLKPVLALTIGLDLLGEKLCSGSEEKVTRLSQGVWGAGTAGFMYLPCGWD